MSEDTPDSLIPYDEIVQEALRAVVGRVLGEVESSGTLPGDHHFYITFKTGAAGVDIPRHLSERFPDEMTIVIQNRFWDLKVADKGFEVGLSFNQTPAKLVIPFSAITGFVDPAVNFALQFQAQADENGPQEHEEAENDHPIAEPVEDGSNVVSVDFSRKK
ncbi:MAG TPA: ClpXP protease specificity-enhancing factor SspB [Allosphingosinicella sp.]|nr:ClpXP protease specificity-enhancing factor SspB [Allosphingosinicella sp.]